jgi:hypothetical protein
MKARGLVGEYCQTCSETLHAHFVEPSDVIALCNECLRTFKSTGDYGRFKSGEWKKEGAEPGVAAREEGTAAEETEDKGLKEQHDAENKGFVSRVRAKMK